ncbi:MAG: valine--tRNA ligase [Microgenomates group bacterium]
MESKFSPTDHEKKIYEMWEKSGAFTPKIDKTKKPFTIILPPPNANEALHAGHALFTVEDIMVRYHRMLGDPTLWLPGTDHAGIETQFVFEKYLKTQSKSRFDYDRETLYGMIMEYVNKNRTVAVDQMKRLGFSLDWTREKFTLDPKHTKTVYEVFAKMHEDGLIYRDEKIVNYCTFCGTAFSNLEVNHKSVNSHLWYIKYGPLTVATTRPETMLGDTAVAVNPKDKRYAKLVGTKIILPIVGREILVIAEETIDIKFGTGAVKVTPSHSPEDYDMAKKHGLEFVRIFDYDGRANENVPEKYLGMFPSQVREAVINDLTELGLVEKIEDHSQEVGHCYRCGRPIEPITAPQWFVKIKPLADGAIKVVKGDKIKFFPVRFKKEFLRWMNDIRDWPISRQIVWGQRIPAWYVLDIDKNINLTFIDKDKKTVTGVFAELEKKYKFEEIKSGLQSLIAPPNVTAYLDENEAKSQGTMVLQETDTFDTWFSSGQWPYSTLGWDKDGKHSPDFEYFYPTTVLDTMWDILFFWVARMIMMGVYVTGQIPFEVAHMHSRVVDAKGVKMSKSKGNVINPLTLVDQYGADALRMALVYGVAPGSDIPLSDDKVKAQRNFANKIWNAARFILMQMENKTVTSFELSVTNLENEDKEILDKLKKIVKSTTTNLEKYKFGQASEDLYQFFWHDFCDSYIESTKDRGAEVIPVLSEVLHTSLKLLHPFMPFVTEAIYQETKEVLGYKEEILISAQWPK